jgi:hypothetical protein
MSTLVISGRSHVALPGCSEDGGHQLETRGWNPGAIRKFSKRLKPLGSVI